MSKAQELLKSSAAVLTSTASVRPAPAGMGSVASVQTDDGRRQGLERSKTSFSVPVGRIVALSQPREEFDEEKLESLAESLRRDGLLHPISVLWMADAKAYRIVSGERRFRAALRNGWESIPCNILDRPLADDELLALQCIENLQRDDLKPIERARAFHTLLTVNGWTVTRIAKEMGFSHSSVSQTLALLKLPEDQQKLVEDEVLSPVAGYHVSKIEDPAIRSEVVEAIVSRELTRDEVIAEVERAKAREATARASDAGPRAAKGRGAGAAKSKAKASPWPAAEWSDDSPAIKVTAIGKRRRKFTAAELLEALERAAARVRAEVEVGQGGDAEAA